jgi:hypothetical protein
LVTANEINDMPKSTGISSSSRRAMYFVNCGGSWRQTNSLVGMLKNDSRSTVSFFTTSVR